MRKSEQYRRISWDCINLKQRQLWVPASKNGTARCIPLNDAAIRALTTLRERSDGTGAVMRSVGGHGRAAGEALVTPKQWFAAACRKAGLDGYTWHANRHTFASRLVMAGVPLRTVQELMGHKGIQMTCRYAHLADEHQLEAVMKLDNWGKRESQCHIETPHNAPPAPEKTGTKTGTRAFRPIPRSAGKLVYITYRKGFI